MKEKILVLVCTASLALSACGAYSEFPHMGPQPKPVTTPDPVREDNVEPAPPIETPFDLSSWNDLIGYYEITSFDGYPTPRFTSEIRRDFSFWNYPNSVRPLSILLIPLYDRVDDKSGNWQAMGPILALGNGSITTVNGIKTYKYSYHGPVANAGGVDLQIRFDITIEKVDTDLQISYELETAHANSKIGHTMTFTRRVWKPTP